MYTHRQSGDRPPLVAFSMLLSYKLSRNSHIHVGGVGDDDECIFAVAALALDRFNLDSFIKKSLFYMKYPYPSSWFFAIPKMHRKQSALFPTIPPYIEILYARMRSNVMPIYFYIHSK